MKKLILSMAAVVAFAFTTEAQTRKGTILLGAGSDLTNTEWTDLQITPKVGFFVQDGVAIGAIVNFSNRTQDEKDPANPTTEVSLSSSNMTLGAFVRYYVSNNVFAELEVASNSSKTDQYDFLTALRTEKDEFGNVIINPATNAPNYVENNEREVFELSSTSTNFGLGLGYTIVFKEHFALEPYVKLQLTSGDETTYNPSVNNTADLAAYPDNSYELSTQKFNETSFNLGVNFSLFF